MESKTIVFLVGLAVIWWAASVWFAWVTAEHRGWMRGVKDCEDIWKRGYLELLDTLYKRRSKATEPI